MNRWGIWPGKERIQYHGLASVIRSTLALREELLRLDPWIPFPQNSCCFSFGEESRPLPIGALFLLWDRWPAATGECPVCDGLGLACGFGGLLNVGGVQGCCSACGALLSQRQGGMVAVANQVIPYLKQTPFFLKSGMFGGAVSGPRAPLLEALVRLGASDLPDSQWVLRGDGPAAGQDVEP